MTVVDDDNVEAEHVVTLCKASMFLKILMFSESKNEHLIYVSDLAADSGIFLTFQLAFDAISSSSLK